VIQGAELGLTPGSALNSAYLVPFKNNTNGGEVWEAQLIVSAQGLCELIYRSGLVSFVSAEVVYRGDDFVYELGLEPKLLHIPMDETIDPAEITHAYMVVGLKDGSRIFKVMTRKAIDRIRDRSPQGGTKGPWKDHYAEMARKTVIKNGSKYVPKSIEVARAVALDHAQETGDFSALDFDTPDALPETSAPALGTSAKVAGQIITPAADEYNPFEEGEDQGVLA
jgi:recombination protein RecT